MEGMGEEKLYMYFPVLKSVKADLNRFFLTSIALYAHNFHTPTIFTSNIHNAWYECRGSNLHNSICCEVMMHSSRKQKLYCLNPS